MLRTVLVLMFLSLFATPLWTQEQEPPAHLLQLEKEAEKAVREFCDKAESVENRLGASTEAMLRLREAQRVIPRNVGSMIARIAAVANDNEESDRIRISAYTVRLALDYEHAVEGLLELLLDFNSGGPELREWAVSTIRVIANRTDSSSAYGKKIIRIFQKVMRGPDDIPVRKQAITFLVEWAGDMDAVGFCALAIAQNTTNPTFSCPVSVCEAMDAFAMAARWPRSGMDYWPMIRPALRNPDPAIRIKAIHLLSMDNDSFETFISLLQDGNEDQDVRAAAAMAVAYRHPEYHKLIVPLIQNTNEDYLRARFIHSLLECIVRSDWQADPDNRKELADLSAICNKWSLEFNGEAKKQAAIAAGVFSRIAKEYAKRK